MGRPCARRFGRIHPGTTEERRASMTQLFDKHPDDKHVLTPGIIAALFCPPFFFLFFFSHQFFYLAPKGGLRGFFFSPTKGGPTGSALHVPLLPRGGLNRPRMTERRKAFAENAAIAKPG